MLGRISFLYPHIYARDIVDIFYISLLERPIENIWIPCLKYLVYSIQGHSTPARNSKRTKGGEVEEKGW